MRSDRAYLFRASASVIGNFDAVSRNMASDVMIAYYMQGKTTTAKQNMGERAKSFRNTTTDTEVDSVMHTNLMTIIRMMQYTATISKLQYRILFIEGIWQTKFLSKINSKTTPERWFTLFPTIPRLYIIRMTSHE